MNLGSCRRLLRIAFVGYGVVAALWVALSALAITDTVDATAILWLSIAKCVAVAVPLIILLVLWARAGQQSEEPPTPNPPPEGGAL